MPQESPDSNAAFTPPPQVAPVVGAVVVVVVGVVVVVADAVVAAVLEIVSFIPRSYPLTTGIGWEHAGLVRGNFGKEKPDIKPDIL